MSADRDRDAAPEPVNLLVAEREFLEASVAVWREIDKHIDRDGHYIAARVPDTLKKDGELRRAELQAWRRYRAALDVQPGALHEDTDV